MVIIVEVKPEIALAYSAFTFPRFQAALQNLKPSALVALGAESWGKPIGLCLAWLNSERLDARLLSVFVQKEYRQAGVASALLRATESELITRHCRSVQADYLSDWSNRGALDQLLRACGWDIRRQAMVFRGTIKPASSLMATMRNARLSPGCEIVPWFEVSANERMAVRRDQDKLQYPEELSPFSEEDSIAPNSIALRYRGSIVGWHIAHLVPPDYVRHSRTFIREDLRTAAQGCVLIREAVRRHAESPLAESSPRYFFHVGAENERMLRLVDKRISPVINSTAVAFAASKTLCPST